MGFQFDADHPIGMRLLLNGSENPHYCTDRNGLAATAASTALSTAEQQASIAWDASSQTFRPVRLLGILILAAPGTGTLTMGITQADGTVWHGGSQGLVLSIPTSADANSWIELGGMTGYNGFAVDPGGGGTSFSGKLIFALG